MYGAGDQLKHVMLNAPVPVNFCGLLGTTMSMQESGWQLAVETYADRSTSGYIVRLAGRHPGMNLRVLSYPTPFSISQFMNARSAIPPIEFNLYICAEHISMQVAEAPRFNQVDFSKPSLEEITHDMIGKHVTLDECCIFKPMNDEVDIYVPENKIWTVMEHLKAIKDLQYDKQKELRQKARKNRERGQNHEGSMMVEPNQYDERKEVKLQLVSVAS